MVESSVLLVRHNVVLCNHVDQIAVDLWSQEGRKDKEHYWITQKDRNSCGNRMRELNCSAREEQEIC